MNENIWIFIVIGLAVILGVLLYNMYREQEYRRQVRRQFGHSDKDALLDSSVESVRDGKPHGKQGAPVRVPRQTDLGDVSPPTAPHAQAAPAADGRNANGQTAAAEKTPDLFAENTAAPVLESSPNHTEPSRQFVFERAAAPVRNQEFVADKRELLLDLHEMAQQDLGWFDPRFDYRACVSLREPYELHSLPRFAGSHRCQIAGCTMDNRWQPAEPIPGVYYQGFIIGMQAVSRSGLASVQDLEAFGGQVDAFAAKLNAGLMLTDIETFLQAARPLDEVCERVDQTIAIHLVSPGTVAGADLRAAAERFGFELAADGAFYFADEEGRPLFSLVNIDNSAFTPSLLEKQSYRGFSMLFDLPHVPAGEKQFNRFMDLVVSLSSDLGLNLVNDKLEELSTEWLKNVRSYVLARQDEMLQIGIEPGGSLAGRLFS